MQLMYVTSVVINVLQLLQLYQTYKAISVESPSTNAGRIPSNHHRRAKKIFSCCRTTLFTEEFRNYYILQDQDLFRHGNFMFKIW